MVDTRRRVKLYALNAERQWDDRGTGHVSSSYVDRLKGISLLVRAEADGSLLLESKIQPDTAYQKQQDTLIVWSEGDNFDLALSFQEKAGCDEIWEKICQVQGKDPSVEITQDVVEESEDERFEEVSDPIPAIELPDPELDKLEFIQEVLASCLVIPMRREKLALSLESNENFIKKLLICFQVAEETRDTNALHHLFHIFRTIFMLNKNAIFEILFNDELILDVIGCLEYDPGVVSPKKHREYLKELTKYREVLKITNTELLNKIHQTYRVQYIHDSVLPAPTAYEENMLTTLSSFIFFNKVEIVTLIQEDANLLNDLFSELKSQGIPESRRKDLILFLKELCAFAQNLQPQAREGFYKTLTQHGILCALELSLPISDRLAKSASIDVLTAVVEFSPSVVREYCFSQTPTNENDQFLLNVIIRELISDSDPGQGGAVQLSGVLRMLIDPDNMLAAINKSEKVDFLNLFYKHSMQVLIEPLLEETVESRSLKDDDLRTAQLLWIVLELLSFCVEHHTYHIKSYIINKDLLRRVLLLMASSHTFVVLGALRLLRKVVSLKDDLYVRYIIKGNLLAPVFEAFKRNNGRYNLLDSAIIELFEYIKIEEMKVLIAHIVENFSDIIDEVNYVPTFRCIKLRYEQNVQSERFGAGVNKDRSSIESAVAPILRSNRFRRDPRQMEEEEEIWFNEDEELEDSGEGIVPSSNTTLSSSTTSTTNNSPTSPLANSQKNTEAELDSIGKLLDKRTTDSLSPKPCGNNSSVPPISLNTLTSTTTDVKPVLPTKSMFQELFANYCSQGPVTQVGLVDYDGDSDEEELVEREELIEDIENSEEPATKKTKLS